MLNPSGKLTLIAGLPGSGKSTWIEANAPSTQFFIADDFMAHSYGNISKFAYSRWYFPLVFALRAGRDAIIADIAFCDSGRRCEAERIMVDAVHNLKYQWVFFANDPDACRQNVLADEKIKGRKAESRLSEIKARSQRYQIPAEATVETVFKSDV